MAKHLLPLFCLLIACSPPVSSQNQCVRDPDCGADLVCDEGTCVAQPTGTCRSDETRPCGPEAVGVCKPGVHRCINGVFETTCFGEKRGSGESCNGLDDDCDGTVDDGVITVWTIDSDGDGFGSAESGASQREACEQPTGYVANASDCDDRDALRKPTASELCDAANVDENCDGVANEGCSCANPGMTQACCSGRGTQTCVAMGGSATLSMCTAQPSLELCNAIDDDCDGMTDESFSLRGSDGGLFALDAGTLLADGGCTVGVGACARNAAPTCVQGTLGCPAVAGTPGAEVCNTLDDDCDGETDEASPGLCPAMGQTCSAGACACPSGQSVCGSSCESLGGSCSNGVGACARTGAIACVSGGPACDAVPGTPSTETCDGADNDCDGQTDEGVQITCLPDADNDRYPGSMTTSLQCPDATRAAYGNCPAGFVAPAAALGTGNDCNDGSAAVFVLASVRNDADTDGYCAGASSTQCIGASPMTGTRLATSCQATDDCNDASASTFRIGALRNDFDSDGYCVGGTFTQCIGTNPMNGTRFASSCQATDDCSDTDGARYRLLSVMADADGDGVCAGSTFQQCTGQNPQPGFRLSSACSPFGGPPPLDCNDASASEWQLLSVRTDADGDSWCAGTPFDQCTGNSAKPGTRLASQCAGSDCRDSNPNATSTCQLTTQSQVRVKACGAGIQPTQTLTFDWACPTGFFGSSSSFAKTNPEARITDPAEAFPFVSGNSSTTGVAFTCRSLAVGQDSWRLDVICSAQ